MKKRKPRMVVRRRTPRVIRKSVRMNPRPRNAFFELRVFYSGGLDRDMDKILFRAVGKISIGSGCMLIGDFTRDHEWEFTKASEAINAAKRILKAVQENFYKTGDKTKVKVEIWNTRPIQIYAGGAPK